MTGTIEKRPDHIKFSGRILFLTDDTKLIRQQLEAETQGAATPRCLDARDPLIIRMMAE